MALNSLSCADVPLRNCSLSHSRTHASSHDLYLWPFNLRVNAAGLCSNSVRTTGRRCVKDRSCSLFHLILNDLISSGLTVALRLVTAMVNWDVRCQATQFAVTATNHSALSSDEMRSFEIEGRRWG